MSGVIVAAPPIQGETVPLLQIARGLVARGHQVTVVAGNRFAQEAADTGAGFVALTGAADFDDRRLAEHFPDRARVSPGFDQVNYDWSVTFGGAMADQYRALQKLLAADPDQVLVSNTLFLGAFPVALGAPGLRPRRWVAVSATPVYLASADTTPFGPVPVGPGEDQRAANTAANGAFAAATEPARQNLTAAVTALGATSPWPPLTDAVVTVPDAFAALTVPELEFVRSDAPPGLRLVGALPAGIPEDWTPPTWWSELDGDRPVVVVTQGTLANDDLGELVEPTLAGLADRDVLVVAALGRPVDSLSGPVPANARVEPFLPFGALLPKADLLITNGGFGAVQMALASGVPSSWPAPLRISQPSRPALPLVDLAST